MRNLAEERQEWGYTVCVCVCVFFFVSVRFLFLMRYLTTVSLSQTA